MLCFLFLLSLVWCCPHTVYRDTPHPLVSCSVSPISCLPPEGHLDCFWPLASMNVVVSGPVFCRCVFVEAFSLSQLPVPPSGGGRPVVMVSKVCGRGLPTVGGNPGVPVIFVTRAAIGGRACLVLALGLSPSQKCKDTPFWEPWIPHLQILYCRRERS